MKQILSRWGAVLSPGLLVAGAAAVAIALNVLLLGYASAGESDPVGRFRPQLTGSQTLGVPNRATAASKTRASERQDRAERPRRPPAPPSSPSADVLPAYGSAEEPPVSTEPESQPGESDDD